MSTFSQEQSLKHGFEEDSRRMAVIRGWLILLAMMVYAMILIGGATRLTDSGLSITEWAPISGALPPLSADAWQSEFDKYRQTTEYQEVNRGMTMGDFQFIYWWEWGHRQMGRLIGLVAVGGFALFAIRRWMSGPLSIRIGVIIALGGLQGAIGWWMVSSGVGETSRVDVAPYRLMTHFSLALLIIALIAWTWLDVSGRRKLDVSASARAFAIILLSLTAVQMAAGALVAGLDAGRSYNDWPLMLGEFVPTDYWVPEYGPRNPFENRATVQFNHRIFGYTLWAVALFAAWQQRSSALGKGYAMLAALVTLQALWGIWTLVSAAPLGLALVHQGLGVLVTLVAVALVWFSSPPRGKAAVYR